MSLKLVPFSDVWIDHDKIDIHAIYKRPRFIEDAYGETQREYVNGLPTWDLTGPLPVRLHNRWRSKGFEYVTLANRESLRTAARAGTLPPGTKIDDFDQHQTGGPWNYKRYAEGQTELVTQAAKQLEEDVALYGSDAVEGLRRRYEPGFVLPEKLRGIPAPKPAKAERAS